MKRLAAQMRTLAPNFKMLTASVVVAASMLIGVDVCPALAQHVEAPSAPADGASDSPTLGGLSDIQFLVTPYLWTPWVGVGVNPSNSRIPDKSGTIDFGKLVNHLSWVPFMGAAEVRDGPIGVVVDYLHVPLKAGLNTGDILFNGGTGGLVVDTGTAMFFYRAISQPDQYLDIGMGVRAWGLSGGITLNRGLLPSFSVTDGTSWADPLIGVRYHQDFPNGFGMTASGDVGGFGVGAHIDWQLMATIDYTVSSGVVLHAGFRSLNFDEGLPRAGLTVNMYGPIVAATLHV